MRKYACQIALALLITATSVRAEVQPDAAPNELSQKMRLAEQKSRLIETLMNTPAMKKVGEEEHPEASAWLRISRTLFDQAQESMRQQQPETAIEKLDEALRSLSKASSSLASSQSASIVAKTRQFEELDSQLASYRRALEDMSAAPQTAVAARNLLNKLDLLRRQSHELFEKKRHDEANRRMDEAYKLAVSEISRLREGQEVVLTLNFSSPREEFDYEQKRYHSNQILVGMLTREGRAQGPTRELVENFVNAAEKMKAEASSKAGANDYKEGIRAMEAANQQLNRALQLMGVPVF